MKNHFSLRSQSVDAPTAQYVFWIVCIIPLFFIPIGFPDPFYFPKMLLWFVSFIAVLMALFLTRMRTKEALFIESDRAKAQNRTMLVLILFTLSWLVSTLFSVDKPVSLLGAVTQNGLLQLLVGIATFLLVANHYVFKSRHMKYVAIVYSLISLLAILQFYHVDPFASLYGEYVLRFDKQIFATIGNQNQVATCLCVAYILIAIYYIIQDPKNRWNRLLLLGVFTIFAGNVATYSKAGLIATVATMLIALPLIKANRVYVRRYVVVFIGSLMIYAVMSLTSNAAVMNRLLQMFFEGFEMIQGNFDSEFGSGRVQIWFNSIDLIKHYWAFGSGPDTFKQIYEAFGLNRIDTNGEIIVVLSPHNESLRLLITTGLASLVFYWLLVITILRNGFHKIKNDILLMPFILGLICYEIKLMFNCSSICDIIIFWVLMAIVYSRAAAIDKLETAKQD